MSAPTPSAGWRRSKLGDPELARAEAWRSRAKADIWLFAGAVVIAGWCLLIAEPYVPCILVLIVGALTFLALPFAWPGRFPLFRNGKPGTAVEIAVVFTFVLTLRSIHDFLLLDWYEPLLPAALGGLLLAGLPAAAARRADPRPTGVWTGAGVTTFLLIGLGLGWSLAVQANALLAEAEPAVHRLRLEQKWTTSASDGGTSYFARLIPEIEGMRGTDYRVSEEVYAATPIGAELCLARWQGFLGYRFYAVGACEEPAS